jgi:hypothetical protein
MCRRPCKTVRRRDCQRGRSHRFSPSGVSGEGSK